jgi:hypothetical protein
VADSSGNPVRIVRGEIQPWTDYEGARRPAGGPVLRALLADLLPATASRVLIAGPHGRDVIELVAARCERVTVLLRSVSDALAIHEWSLTTPEAAKVNVVSGALDGLAGAEPATDGSGGGEPFDVVIAADGLDRVLGTDSPALNWPQRAAALRGLAAADALFLLGVTNEVALTGLLDRRPAHARHGDEEWRPLYDDPDRPTSPAQITEALRELGCYPRRRFALFDEAGVAHTLLDGGAAARTRPGRPGARLAIAGLAAAGAHTPLLASLADGADAAARAGLLDAVAPGWLMVCGPGPDVRTAYATVGGVLGLDLSPDGWSVTVLPTEHPPLFDPGLVAKRVPDTESVETVLFRLAAAEDVPGFRALAGRLGRWAEADALLCLDDVQVDGDGFARGLSGWRAEQVSRPELLAATWHRFRDRLVRGHRRHPWPPWMADGDDLIRAWLAMSGVPATDEVITRGREIADRIAAAADTPPDETDLRTALADAAAAQVRAAELAGHIFGLERTLRFRDQSLRTREQQVRATRDALRELRGSRAMRITLLIRKVAAVRHPRRLVRAVKRRLRAR